MYSELAVYEATSGVIFCPQVSLTMEDVDLCPLGASEGLK